VHFCVLNTVPCETDSNVRLYSGGEKLVEPMCARIAGTNNSTVVYQGEEKCLNDTFTF
jgi:hypothetical protein